ncbi:MAG: polyprenyl synthetase family protein [Desulfobacterium sp.]|jgi:octaprenyl-diphosphate synthase|nr:polyprenyl synthetase family protein [Desulfobacterium sp.]
MKDALKHQILAAVEEDLTAIELALAANLKPNLHLVRQIAGHLLFSGGKRFRPLLFLLSSRLCNYEGRLALNVSTLFEYLHAATLLHDDVVDEAKLRRGRTTAHTTWGTAQVVLTGDFLLACALRLAAEAGLVEIIRVIAGITEEMSQGEIDQLEKKEKLDLTQAEYLAIISAKTAVLIQGACKSGAIIAGASRDKEQALADYGFHLGVAFQMADDLLDYTADAQTLGKNPGADLREGKLTLPLILALERADDKDRSWMKGVILNPDFTDDDFEKLVQKLYLYRGIDDTRLKAEHHVAQAKKSLELFDDCPTKKTMIMLSDYTIARNV